MGLGGLAAKVAAGSGSGSSMSKLAGMACMARKCKERMGSCSYRLVVELPVITNKVFLWNFVIWRNFCCLTGGGVTGGGVHGGVIGGGGVPTGGRFSSQVMHSSWHSRKMGSLGCVGQSRTHSWRWTHRLNLVEKMVLQAQGITTGPQLPRESRGRHW